MLLLSAAICLAQAQSTFEVPFRMGDNAIIVDAMVNGKQLSLMFDSGFGGAVVANDELDLGAPDGTQLLRDFVGQYSAKTVKIKSLVLAGHAIELEEPEAIEQPAAHLTAAYDTHTDGILGLQAIENYVTEINFEQKKMIFHPKSFDITKNTPDGKKTFLTRMLPLGADSVELTATTADGQRMILALDTGNSFYVTINRDVLERIGGWREGQSPKFSSTAFVASGPVSTWTKQMENMTIFGIPVPKSFWDIIDLPSSNAQGDGTVGIEFLRNFNITIDYDRRKVWLDDFSGQIANPPKGQTGITAGGYKGEAAVEVLSVTPESPADKAGIRKGDRILEIDGVEASPSWTMRQLSAKIDGVPGTKVKLAISHNGQLSRYELDRAALFN